MKVIAGIWARTGSVDALGWGITAKKAFLCALLSLAMFPSSAQTCCSGGAPLSANLGLPPSLQGTLQLNITYDRNVLNTLKEGTAEINDRSRKRLTHTLILTGAYAITDKIGIEALLPLVRQERKISQPSGFTDFERTEGIGDVLLLLKYRVTDISDQKNVFSIGVGPKFATGASDQTNDAGITLSADLQPGSGATDLLLWTHYIYQGLGRQSMSLYASATYRLTGKNQSYLGSSSYEIGDNLRALIGMSDQLVVGTRILTTSLSLRFRHALEDRFNDGPLTSSGGDWVFLIPALGARITPDLTLESSLELPVYSNPNGIQLTPTYRFNVGVYFILPGKKSGDGLIEPLVN